MTWFAKLCVCGVCLAVAGCAQVPGLTGAGGVSDAPPAAVATGDSGLRPQARPDDLDTTAGASVPADVITGSEEPERAASGVATTTVTLGTPTEPGNWIKTPLVDAPRSGEVRNPATGTVVAVQMIPLDGPATAGSRMSLGAMQALGVSLTAVTEIEVLGV
ncbi:MAG: hypothetical protein AAFO93_13850 [Pseudomonadota bacterium]